jgi:hypothetical protein
VCAFRIPYTIAVRCDYVEGVIAWRRMRIVCRAARTSIDPIRLYTEELVFEADALGIRKAEGRVLYFEAGMWDLVSHGH